MTGLRTIAPGLKSIGGTWSTITDSGEATYLNMIHLTLLLAALKLILRDAPPRDPGRTG